MIAAAEHIFRMARCGTDGVSVGEKLAHIEATTGRRPAELDGPPVPPQVTHILEWFFELSSARTGNGFGPNPLTWTDFDAWARLMNRVVRPWEIEMLRALDRCYLASVKPVEES